MRPSTSAAFAWVVARAWKTVTARTAKEVSLLGAHVVSMSLNSSLVCFGQSVLDCEGVCDGTAYMDECTGVCMRPGKLAPADIAINMPPKLILIEPDR